MQFKTAKDRLLSLEPIRPLLAARPFFEKGGRVVKPFAPGFAVVALAAAFIVAIPRDPAPSPPEGVATAGPQTVEIAEQAQGVAGVEITAQDGQTAAPREDDATDAKIAAPEVAASAAATPEAKANVEAQPAAPEAPGAREEAAAPRDSQPSQAARGGARPRVGKIVIDPGHGATDIGANRTFPDGYLLKEADLTLKVSRELSDRLKGDGFQVILTRDSGNMANSPARDRTGDGRVTIGDDLQARIDVANNAQADLFVSVHFNAAGNQQGGTEVFYCEDRPFADKSRKMAEFLQDNLLKGMRSLGYESPNRGVKRDTQSAAGTHLYVLGPKTSIIAKPVNAPSVLGEALFISNNTEGNMLRDAKTVSTIAEAYYKAIVQYFDWLG